MKSTRAGFVLVTILWVVVAAATFVTDVGLEVAVDLRAAEHRVIAERAYWIARGCSARLRVELERELGAAVDPIRAERVWDELDTRLAARRFTLTECEVELEAAGTRVGLNDASEPQLRRLASLAGAPGSAEFIAMSIVERRGTLPFADARELRVLLAAADDARALEPFVTADSGLLSLNHASREALLAASGLPGEAVDRLLRRRAIGIMVASHRDLEDGISADAAEAVRANMPAIAALTTVSPEWWTVRFRVPLPAGRGAFRMEERLGRAERLTAVLEVRLP